MVHFVYLQSNSLHLTVGCPILSLFLFRVVICPMLCPFEKPIPVVEFKVDFYTTICEVLCKKKDCKG